MSKEELKDKKEKLDEKNEELKDEKEVVSKEDYEKVVRELKELKEQLPREESDEEKALKQKEEELWKKQVQLELKENGLEKFYPLIKVEKEEELKEIVKELNQIINDIKVETGYIPENHAKDNEFNRFEEEKNTKGMIGVKLANLFR